MNEKQNKKTYDNRLEIKLLLQLDQIVVTAPTEGFITVPDPSGSFPAHPLSEITSW